MTRLPINPAPTPATRVCKHAKAVELTEETFVGLFTDTPISTASARQCERCGALVRDWSA